MEPILWYLILDWFKWLSILFFAWNIIPWFSLNNNLVISASSILERSISKPIPSLTKHISKSDTNIPPELMSCPENISPSLIRSWIELKIFLKLSEDVMSLHLLPILLFTWYSAEPPSW